ncbi:hypothetical protein CC79DRAFT_1396193 [Sarocladium strictum]
MAELISNESIGTSRPITFKVGESGKEFFLHSELVARLSEPLQRLVNGSFSEARSGIVTWNEVDEATFISFSQYVYTGTYQVQEVLASPRKLSDSEAEHGLPPAKRQKKAAQPAPAEGAAITIVRTPKVVRPASMAEQLRIYLSRRLWQKRPLGTPSFPTLVMTSELSKSSKSKDYAIGSITLAHARLYIFADCYGITKLASKALSNVHHILWKVRIHVDDKLLLARFCSKNTLPHTLRDMFLTYIASRTRKLWRRSRFQTLLQEDRELEHEILDKMMEVMPVP